MFQFLSPPFSPHTLRLHESNVPSSYIYTVEYKQINQRFCCVCLFAFRSVEKSNSRSQLPKQTLFTLWNKISVDTILHMNICHFWIRRNRKYCSKQLKLLICTNYCAVATKTATFKRTKRMVQWNHHNVDIELKIFILFGMCMTYSSYIKWDSLHSVIEGSILILLDSFNYSRNKNVPHTFCLFVDSVGANVGCEYWLRVLVAIVFNFFFHCRESVASSFRFGEQYSIEMELKFSDESPNCYQPHRTAVMGWS